MNIDKQKQDKPLKVERDYIYIGKKRQRLRYRDVKSTCGWADCREFLPADLDLMKLKIKGKPHLELYGWIYGDDWVCFKADKDDQIFMWKKVS